MILHHHVNATQSVKTVALNLPRLSSQYSSSNNQNYVPNSENGYFSQQNGNITQFANIVPNDKNIDTDSQIKTQKLDTQADNQDQLNQIQNQQQSPTASINNIPNTNQSASNQYQASQQSPSSSKSINWGAIAGAGAGILGGAALATGIGIAAANGKKTNYQTEQVASENNLQAMGIEQIDPASDEFFRFSQYIDSLNIPSEDKLTITKYKLAEQLYEKYKTQADFVITTLQNQKILLDINKLRVEQQIISSNPNIAQYFQKTPTNVTENSINQLQANDKPVEQESTQEERNVQNDNQLETKNTTIAPQNTTTENISIKEEPEQNEPVNQLTKNIEEKNKNLLEVTDSIRQTELQLQQAKLSKNKKEKKAAQQKLKELKKEQTKLNNQTQASQNAIIAEQKAQQLKEQLDSSQNKIQEYNQKLAQAATKKEKKAIQKDIKKQQKELKKNEKALKKAQKAEQAIKNAQQKAEQANSEIANIENRIQELTKKLAQTTNKKEKKAIEKDIKKQQKALKKQKKAAEAAAKKAAKKKK